MQARRRYGLRVLFGTSIALVAGVGTGAALAATVTNAPGAYCTAINGGSLTIRSDGEAENRSASLVTVLCPVERPASSTTANGQVHVVDRNANNNICCRLVSQNVDGTRINGTSDCSTGNSASTQTLTLGELNDSFSYSHFFVECHIPAINGAAASRVQMYRTTQ